MFIRTSTPAITEFVSGRALHLVAVSWYRAYRQYACRFNLNGWFVGGGVENNLNIFGITAPGWFMKTEYRAAYFSKATLGETLIATGAPTGLSDTFHPLVQTVSHLAGLSLQLGWPGGCEVLI